MASYQNDCFNSFYDGQITYFTNFTPVPEDYECSARLPNVGRNQCPETVVAEFDWESGNGFICLLVATLLKVIDIVCHFIVPTPSITRDIEEQEEYERKYGKGAVDNDDDLGFNEEGEPQPEQPKESGDYGDEK